MDNNSSNVLTPEEREKLEREGWAYIENAKQD